VQLEFGIVVATSPRAADTAVRVTNVRRMGNGTAVEAIVLCTAPRITAARRVSGSVAGLSPFVQGTEETGSVEQVPPGSSIPSRGAVQRSATMELSHRRPYRL
jgi:hypothetical protein